MRYSDFIAGKRVAFVGACPNLTGKKTGEFIDGFDVVVKTNGSVFLASPEYNSDYGSRVDVLYTNHQFYREMRGEFHKFPLLGVQYLRMKSCKPDDLPVLRKMFPADIITQAIENVNRTVTSALMGCYLIQDILQCKPAELYLTGIDFFATKKPVFEHDNYQEYLPAYLPQRIREQGNRINKGKKADGHDQKSNTKFIYEQWKAGRVTMPDFILSEMLKIMGEKC
jgi:hypothetical protein